jgi:apolipoprotein D and lipocalin family protein
MRGNQNNNSMLTPLILLVTFALLLSGCVGLPENVKPVDHFNADRYLGKWYEIARLDHSFERGLSKVSASYSKRDDGGIRVINRGYDAQKQKWKEAEGKAYFVNGADQGYLKVSFFGPFYGAYVVVDLDHENYQYSLVSGPDKSYLWILSRTPQMDQETQKRLVEKAAALGFDTGRLIFVEQDK